MPYINPLYQYWRPEETTSPSEDRVYALTYYHSLLYRLSSYILPSCEGIVNRKEVEKKIEKINQRLEELT